MNKVYLVYYTGWDDYIPTLMSIKTTKEKADAYIDDAIVNDTSLSGKVDDFHVYEWDLE